MPESHLKFHSRNGKRQLLVVEDELINRELLRMILQDTYEILFAETGGKAIGILEEQYGTISLVLLDLNLPDIHGLDVLRHIKSSLKYPELPVIVMTAEKESEVESLQIGAIDFIPKPYPQPKVILARIQRTIELSEDRNTISFTERDKLTGLYNREYFYHYAEQFDQFHKDIDTDAIVIDINHFHMLNERYGKSYGDEILSLVATKLKEGLAGGEGILCRKEGDTFLIYCPHMEDHAAFLKDASIDIHGGDRVRLRMGVYPNADKDIDIERRFDRAKSAADTVRNSFTGNIGFYDDTIHKKELFNEQLLEEFHTAIKEKQFRVYFQPKFDVRKEEPLLSSAEALVRWAHPKLGMISPGVFIPLFEDNGLIRELDSYIWRETVAQIRDWKDRLGMTIPVSVNVSRVDMYDEDFVGNMEALLNEFSLEHSCLHLEITESAYTGDSDQIIAKVGKLRENGFLIEMDDFGSGYSSLNMISTLPIDALKLDMQFIRNAFRQRKDTGLLEIVISLAESLNVPTIAEGVETAEQMFTLKMMGCDYIQGYYFSKPLPADEFETFALNAKRKESQKEERRPLRAGIRDRFAYDALHDPLTGMYNHSAFDILFHDSDKDHIAVLLINIDDYAKLRKEEGRNACDRAVLNVATVLRNNFRNVDDICRLKEDEFVVIMTRVTDDSEDLVMDKVETIQKSLAEDETVKIPVTLSFGVAFSDSGSEREGDIFADADLALKQSLKEGKGNCHIFCG